ncbi:YraN family protein [Thiohalomonas denitrificans]|uniref:YraN family protein n=1 Tax=Thiohalomonas denitrificans TaxID=415747 RepID=UPI0026F26D8E|nr:YraN family protein [Thiohalomonas denitrificans]
MAKSETTHARGQHAEELALRYLTAQGLRLLEQNYRCRCGEIDLVMQDRHTLVFVEVRFRSHRSFGGAAASVDARKQRRLINTAHHYLQRHRQTESLCRFDVMAMGAAGDNDIEWLRNAITVTG